MYKPVTRGETLAFIKIYEFNRLLRFLDENPHFTGRLSGMLKLANGEKEFSILVSKGNVLLAVVDDKVIEPARLDAYIREAEDGFIEIESLDNNKINLEIEYAKEAGLELGSWSLKNLLDVLRKASETRESQRVPLGRERSEPQKPRAEESREPLGFKKEASDRGSPGEVRAGEEPASKASPVNNASAPRETLQSAEAEESLIDRLLEILEVNSMSIERLNRIYYNKYNEILRVAEHYAVARRRMKPRSLEVFLHDVLARLSSEHYTVLRYYYLDSEYLLVFRGTRVCLTLEKSRGTVKQAGRSLKEVLSRVPDEYVIYSVDTDKLDRMLTVCVPPKERGRIVNRQPSGIGGFLRRILGGG
ncbi:MAG: hypothetical protein GSR80_001698 [Desulfurococcales archaeon]|nr:hypothetical protein [Desulfurococcales archaeon]